MGLIELDGYNLKANKVIVRRQGNELRLLVDVAIFPLYCTLCNHPQPTLYVHGGSRYGQVGTARCCKCGEEINVIDHDNIVDSIFINNYPSNEIFFKELYLIDVKYLKQLGEEHYNNIKDVLLQLAEEEDFITIGRLRKIVENEMNITTIGTKMYVTDERFSLLPDDVNRWIETLENAGIDNLPIIGRKEFGDISEFLLLSTKDKENIIRDANEAVKQRVKNRKPDIFHSFFFGAIDIAPNHLVNVFIYRTDKELEEAEANGLCNHIKEVWQEEMERCGYPKSVFTTPGHNWDSKPSCTFASQEECDKNYNGNWYYFFK